MSRSTKSKRLKQLLTPLFYKLPRWRAVYRIAKRYANYYDGNNGYLIEFNGELHLLNHILRDKPNALVVDAGANVGEWSQEALKINPSILIHCFEPEPETFKKLKANHFPNTAQLNMIGLGKETVQLQLYVYPNALLNSLHPLPDQTPSKVTQIQIDSLDSYCADKRIDHIDFLKLDIEGHELQALQGAKRMLENNSIDYIQFEYGATYVAAQIYLKNVFDLLRANNYLFWKIHSHGLIPFEHYNSHYEDLQLSNYLAASRRVAAKLGNLILKT